MNTTSALQTVQNEEDRDHEVRATRFRKRDRGKGMCVGVTCIVFSIIGAIISFSQKLERNSSEQDAFLTTFIVVSLTGLIVSIVIISMVARSFIKCPNRKIRLNYGKSNCNVLCSCCGAFVVIPICFTFGVTVYVTKIAFMVCSIIGAAVFMPIVINLGLFGAILHRRDRAVISYFIAALGMIEMIVSIVGASYCCCCSSFGEGQRTKYVYVTANQPGMWNNIPQTQIPNQQIQMPASIPMTTTQPNNQAIAATTQQYQVHTVSAQQYQMPSGAAATAVAHQPVTVDTQPPPYKE